MNVTVLYSCLTTGAQGFQAEEVGRLQRPAVFALAGSLGATYPHAVNTPERVLPLRVAGELAEPV